MKSKTYEEFVAKFKPKKTTDDCYTPPEVYNVIRDWCCKEYKIKTEHIVRPFWPGGDYERFDYPDGCVVLDNPPFSILSKIIKFYHDRGISFFLFAPSLTVLSAKSVVMDVNHIVCNCNIVYDNGAVVRTSFVTNLGDSDIILQSCPELTALVNDTVDNLQKSKTKQLPSYSYPAHVVTAAMVQSYSRYWVDYAVRRNDCVHIAELDSQKRDGKSIYGGGLLLSDNAAAERIKAERIKAERIKAERMAAEKAIAIGWTLSDRERAIISKLGQVDSALHQS